MVTRMSSAGADRRSATRTMSSRPLTRCAGRRARADPASEPLAGGAEERLDLTQHQVATGRERAGKRCEQPLLRDALEIDHDVAAEDEMVVVPGRRIAAQVERPDLHSPPDAVDHPALVAGRLEVRSSQVAGISVSASLR